MFVYLKENEKFTYIGRGNIEDVWRIISEDLQKREVKANYIRSWTEEEEIYYDFGSHSKFYIATERKYDTTT